MSVMRPAVSQRRGEVSCGRLRADPWLCRCGVGHPAGAQLTARDGARGE